MNLPSDVTSENCPSYSDLSAFAVGMLDMVQLDDIAAHVGDCERCQSLLETLEDSEDTLVRQIQASRSQSWVFGEPEFQRLQAWAQTIRVGTSSAADGKSLIGTPPSEWNDDLAPEFLGNEYRLLGRLGKGGMGVVYKAEHLHLKRTVAIKLLPAERLLDRSFVRRFYREIEAVGAVDHANVVRATDAREIDGLHFLVMECVSGIDLARLLRLHGPLSVADACEIVCQTADGLDAIFRAGFVHRDIKPSNLIVNPIGRVKILDLGLALLREERLADSELTKSDQMLGSVDYMAPEQARSSKSVDIRADIYGLGCTLYKLLTGHPPFSGAKYGTIPAKILAHSQHPPPSLLAVRPDAPQELSVALDRLLAKQPSDRPGTPAEVAKLLEPFSTGSNLARLVPDGDRPLVDDQADTSHGMPNASIDTSDAGIRTAGHPSSRRRTAGRLLWLSLLLPVAIIAGVGGLALHQPRSADEYSLPGQPRAATLPKTFEFLSVEQIEPQVQYPLLNVEPEQLFWPEGRLSSIAFQPVNKQVAVICQGTGVLSLGAISERPYSFSVDIYQSNWSGGVGVFWGFCQGADLKNPNSWQYQSLEFRPNVRANRNEYPLVLWRNFVTVHLDEQGYPSMLTESISSVPLNVASRQAHQLEITISRIGLHEVRWRGESIDGVCNFAFDRQIPLENLEGKFGVLVTDAEGIYRNAHITLLRGVVP